MKGINLLKELILCPTHIPKILWIQTCLLQDIEYSGRCGSNRVTHLRTNEYEVQTYLCVHILHKNEWSNLRIFGKSLLWAYCHSIPSKVWMKHLILRTWNASIVNLILTCFLLKANYCNVTYIVDQTSRGQWRHHFR